MKKCVVLLRISLLFLLAASLGRELGGAVVQKYPDRLNSNWLSKVLQDYGGSQAGVDGEDSEMSISRVGIDNNCVFRYSETTFVSFGQYVREDISFPLGAVTEVYDGRAKFGTDAYNVGVTTGQTAAVHVVGIWHGGDDNVWNISVHRRGVARQNSDVPQAPGQVIPRIVSALQHAVSLCQGTFQTHAPSKDPF